MKVKNVVEILDAEIITEGQDLSIEVNTACGSDLMSDVMAYADDKEILLTGLVNPQVIRTAEMMDIKVVIFVRAKRPGEYIINMAKEKGIILLTTKYHMFVACGKLFSEGITGGDESIE
ncbi:MAG TPA: hypothetical protein GX527_02375 [Clostridiaceae bacterium]|jgi:predicted transcriptional regulator|nr:hypothetical protein [Clostridiaceae bacterium]